MCMQKIIAANFKTNHTRASALEYLSGLESFLKDRGGDSKIWVFPPLNALVNNHYSTFQIGTQNAYPIVNGAMTGEVGLEALREFHIQSILLGHSERREHLGECPTLIAKKFYFFAKENFSIFHCIGENLEVRERGEEAVFLFLESQLSEIPLDYPHLIVAYEPIWAIGTGVSATLESIERVHRFLRSKLPNTPLLYGGSVKADNVASILNTPCVDGVLVGSASWKLQDFCTLLENTESTK